MSVSLAEYIKHTRHFDGLGMGDQDLEERAKKIESRIKELEAREHHLPAKNNALRVQIDRKNKRIEELQEKYSELIMAVAQKFPDESRHETALRYIQQRESTCHGPEQASAEI